MQQTTIAQKLHNNASVYRHFTLHLHVTAYPRTVILL